MRKKIKRTRKLLEVQEKMLLTERQELQTIKARLAQAQHEQQEALSWLSEDRSDAVPPSLLVKRALSSTIKIRTSEGLLQAQIEKTLDQARREQMVRKKLRSQREELSKADGKATLQMTIDAYLRSSQMQD
jgi:exopolyphosphatase/pppGpp-phosphohydrolase